jgi:glycine reductase
MDLQSQEEIKRLATKHGTQDLVVVLGSPDPESAEIAAETVVVGDPTFVGPLAGTQLGLSVYHLLEDEIRSVVPTDVWEREVGVMSDVLDGESIASSVRSIRDANTEN